MPDGTGFDLLKKFEKINFKVIFVTAHQEFAIEAFKYSALDYLLKPLSPANLIGRC
jgi:two-component system LytT family response regulator